MPATGMSPAAMEAWTVLSISVIQDLMSLNQGSG